MVVGEPSINNIMSGLENTGGIKQHNHRKKLKQRFDLIKKLGQGTFGKVQLGINKETGQEVAIKTIKKSKIESEADLVRIRREIQIMSSVQHPNIIHIYEVFENKEKMVLVMEYAAGGELYDYLSERKVLNEDEARRIFRQIATACYYCHKHKICHRDLKLENILLDENNNAKIADFGLSNVFDDQRLLNTFCGSPLYASPEIVKGTPYHGPEVDCWSLGVLLYTLVYGAMPFDGSNFKRLVKQISQGDYFEPTNPSPASPLIRDMLTVNPKHRADIEKICNHWWVNENYEENCLEISEHLANQTPVRLDLLLSLAPPPPQLESDKLVVTEDATEDAAKAEASAPARSQSVGSLMELTHPTERRIREFLLEEKAPKRKLESTVSTDRVSLEDLKKKEKIIKENTVADITVYGGLHEVGAMDDETMQEASPLIKSTTQTISRGEMEVEPPLEEAVEALDLEGAACTELIEETKKNSAAEPVRLKRNLTTTLSPKLENINETPSQENIVNCVDKENEKEEKPSEKEAKTVKKKVVKKKILTDKNDNAKQKSPTPPGDKQTTKAEEVQEAPAKPVERRRSRIFEAAEKFQNMITPSESQKTQIEKPKKIIIPGVSVDGFKREFERKASLTSSTIPKLSKKSLSVDAEKKTETVATPATAAVTKAPDPITKPEVVEKIAQNVNANETETETKTKAEVANLDGDRKEKVRNAVSIISNALDKEGARKSKSRPCMMRKPPVPFGVSGRSASGNIGMISTNLMAPVAPKPFVRPNYEMEPHQAHEVEQETPQDDKVSSAEITLKSATLPRRKTTKAEIKLNYPATQPTSTMEFKTEMAHPVQGHPKLSSQRSEVIVPITPRAVQMRASSLEPESVNKSKERIIPICFEREDKAEPQTPPVKPATKVFQRSAVSQQRSNSLSRQSTQDSSDTETIASTGEPIKKSPREYIIPIAIEGGGYVTPRAGSLEPTDSTNRMKSAFSRTKRFSSRVSDRDSEDESPFVNFHRHSSSFGRDSDTEESRREAFHRLRSTRPKKPSMEHAESISSGEDDDDDGFDTLTAENLFSTLLSRVRDLTQRLNVEDGGRPGFPSSRFLSHFDHGTNFWNMHNRADPFSRHSSFNKTFGYERSASETPRPYNTPWRKSLSRDLSSAADKDNAPTDTNMPKENLNLADLDLRKLPLSDEESMALSYLTPALTRRMQKQLLAQLAPSEVRKLHRTLSSRTSDDNESRGRIALNRRSVDRLSETNEKLTESTAAKSFLPVKSSVSRQPADNRNDDMKIYGIRATRSTPRSYTSSSRTRPVYSPESSLSESLSSYTKEPDSVSEFSSQIFSTDSVSSLSRSNNGAAGRYKPQSTANDNASAAKSETNTSRTKRISRFLRPDFYESPKDDENAIVKEKKERELETQKVLKEIRDKRRERLSMKRETSVPKEKKVECSEETTTKTKSIPEYVNVKSTEKIDGKPEDGTRTCEVVKKSRISRLARPKSYPAEVKVPEKETVIVKVPPPPDDEKESKLNRFKRGFRNATKSSKDEEKVHKNKLLHSIEKKLERFRSSPEKLKENSAVENTIRKLREQSLPPSSLNPCTESGLIKRAVSVEDLSNLDKKPLQASRKSVTKILSLFKKYEDVDDNKKSEKSVKKKKTKSRTETKEKESKHDKTTEKMNVITKDEINREIKYNSKLPVNSFRRSLNLDNLKDNVKISKENKVENNEKIVVEKPAVSIPVVLEKPDKKNLKLDFTKVDVAGRPSTSKRYSFDSSHYHLSPSNDDISDSWSLCSETGHSPISPNGGSGQLYSGDESSESVIDRIKRKSFYTRFNNEKKRPKGYLKSYRDLDLYKDLGLGCSKNSSLNSYGTSSSDYKSYVYDKYDYGYHPSGSSSNGSSHVKRREYKPYTSTRSASVLNDYVNLPNHYRPYCGSRTSSSLCSDSDNTVYEDEHSTSLRMKRNIPSTYLKTSSQSSIDERVHIE